MLRRKPVFDRLSLQFILYEEEINMKKLLVTLLAASMCLSMFVGCGSKEEETTTTDKETPTSEATTEDGEESEVAGDVELKEFTILGDYAVNASYYQMDQFEDFYSVIAFRELMEANGLDIKFELINDDQYVTTLQTRFAAMNNVPYFVAMYGLSENEVMQLAAQGVVLDINPMLDESEAASSYFKEDEFGVQAYRKVSLESGEMYWLPNLYITKWYDTLGTDGTNYQVGIRQDWLNDYGLEVPTTLDEFTNALKTFNENDPSGTGMANTAGYHVMSVNPCSLSDNIGAWFGLVRGIISNNWTTQEAISPWHQETIKDYLTYINGLYNMGLYDGEMIGSTSTLTQKYSNNQVGAMNVYTAGAYEQNVNVFDPNSDNPVLFLPMEPIQAVEGVDPLLALEDPVYIWDEFCFTNQLTDLELGARFLEAYYSPENIDLINYGTEGYNYEVVDGEKVFKEYTAAEDGKQFKADQLNQYIQDKAAQNLLFGKHLYSRTITPDYTYYFLDVDAEVMIEKGYCEAKYWIQKDQIENWENFTSIDATGQWATASAEQVEEINLIWNDIDTYSQEAVAALVMGTRSLDEIDAIVAELDALGLADVEVIRQGQYDRFLGK